MSNNSKTSLLIPSQLPEFIRDNPDYSNFVLFIQAYYEWMEQNGNVMDASKNILSFKDVDTTTEQFLKYFTNEFLPFFPEDALVDKRKAIKIARDLYASKGTLASYQFLFKILYNSDFDIFYTKDAVLRASAGNWYVAKSLKLSTTDVNFLNIKNARLFGETTKSIATVETSIRVGSKTEVFISDIQRLFQSGEFVRVVDSNNQDILFNNEPIRAKIVGQISQIKIDPSKRGLLYQPGDPVIVYNGLASSTSDSAIAQVGITTSGSIQRINVLTGGYGYRVNPDTIIQLTNAPGALAEVGSVNPNQALLANVSLISNNSIASALYTQIGNTSYSFFSNNIFANANTSLANSFTFTQFETYPISSVYVVNGGGGITKIPHIYADSIYKTDDSTVVGHVKSLGILAPIQIANGGTGYVANDTIIFSGGTGYGAYANVTSVSNTGEITSVEYVQGKTLYPLGGLGFKPEFLPSLTVLSANNQAANASLFVPSILGDGATFDPIVDRAGSITTINVINPGEDYISTPNISIRVQDIVVSNVSILNIPQKGDVLFQGANVNVSTYKATVNSVSLLTTDANPELSLYNLRVFNYNTQPNPKLNLLITEKDIILNMANTAFPVNAFFNGSPEYDSTGVKNYGDGTAKATASFLNGLVISQGQYLNAQGHPSSFDVLQNEVYNNFTYQITVEKEISKYRDILMNLLHPSGMKVLGRYALKANSNLNMHGLESVSQGHTLYYYTNDAAANATMITDFNNKSTNIIKFNNLGIGVNIANFIFSNSTISLMSANGPNVRSEITSIDSTSNSITVVSNTWLTFANVAFITANANSNIINITTVTNSYDIINNGNYSNTAYPLKDIVYAGDQILIANNTAKTVQDIDYVNGIITLTSNLSANANSLMSVNRTFSSGGTINKINEIIIFGPIGTHYYPELITEDGFTITTEDGKIILLG